MFGTPTDAVVGSGFTLSVAVGTSPVVNTSVLQLRSVKRSGNKTKMVDVTCTSSPAAVSGGLPYEETRPTIISPGTISITGIFGPADASQALMQTLQDEGTLNTWTIQLPNTRGEWVFSAYVSEGGVIDVEFNKEVTYSAALSISGPVTYTSGI
jgi:hypothetical protein